MSHVPARVISASHLKHNPLAVLQAGQSGLNIVVTHSSRPYVLIGPIPESYTGEVIEYWRFARSPGAITAQVVNSRRPVIIRHRGQNLARIMQFVDKQLIYAISAEDLASAGRPPLPQAGDRVSVAWPKPDTTPPKSKFGVVSGETDDPNHIRVVIDGQVTTFLAGELDIHRRSTGAAYGDDIRLLRRIRETAESNGDTDLAAQMQSVERIILTRAGNHTNATS
jgi:hypothetical protein